MTTSPFKIKNIRLFIAFRIFFNARFYYPVFTILFLDYGLSLEQFALLNTVWAITIVSAEIPSGALADLFGRKRLLVATSLLMIFELGIIAFIPLQNMTLVFWAFLINRILSGLAEAMASGADEAIAYDSLKEEGNAKHWPRVLSLQMRLTSGAGIISMTTGALLYDPKSVNTLLHFCGIAADINQKISMRFPIYLTLILAFLALISTLKMEETPPRLQNDANAGPSLAAIVEASRLTLQAGGWIAKTPFALAVIIFGMTYDHVLRLVITLTSQYFRMIKLPEASFGLIMATLSLFGLFVPKIAEKLVDLFSAGQNCMLLTGVTLVALWSLTGFFPYFGIIPIALVMIGLMLTSFYTSHYLNAVSSSEQRATILSFKGLAFNLAYGLIGIFFALAMQFMRGKAPSLPSKEIEEYAFRSTIFLLPWYTLALIAIFIVFFLFIVKIRPEQPATSE